MDTVALIVAVYTVLSTAYLIARALSEQFSFGFIPGVLIYGLAIFVVYRIVLWYQAYSHPAA